MSLLAQVNQPNKDSYYFALDTTPIDPTVTAPAFTATGTATENGTFTAKGDAVPGGIDVFNMARPSNAVQWSMGMVGVPAGANSGNNFALFSYDDNGAFLAGPLTINRATNAMVVAGAMAVGGNVTAPNLPVAAASRVASASFVPDPIVVNPSAAIFTLNAASMPGLAALIANPAVNIIQLFSQFGVQTTAGQPKMNLGLTFQADGGGALLTNGTVCLGQAPPVAGSPAEFPYVLYANLIRGVHFTGTTTSIVVGATADTTPNGAVITLLNNDDNAGTPTSPSIIVSALGMM